MTRDELVHLLLNDNDLFKRSTDGSSLFKKALKDYYSAGQFIDNLLSKKEIVYIGLTKDVSILKKKNKPLKINKDIIDIIQDDLCNIIYLNNFNEIRNISGLINMVIKIFSKNKKFIENNKTPQAVDSLLKLYYDIEFGWDSNIEKLLFENNLLKHKMNRRTICQVRKHLESDSIIRSFYKHQAIHHPEINTLLALDMLDYNGLKSTLFPPDISLGGLPIEIIPPAF